MEEVPIDLDVMVVIEGLAYSVREKSVAQMYRCGKRGIARAPH